MNTATIPTLTLTLLLLLLLPLTTACDRDDDIDKDYRFRQYSLSTTAPTATRLQARPDLQARVTPLLQVMKTLFSTVDMRIARNDSRACNLAKNDWVNAAFKSVKARQIGEYNDICDTRIDGNEAVASDELPEKFISSAQGVIRDAKDALYEALSDINEIPDTFGPVQLRDWDLRRLSQQCTVESAFAYRINEVLYLSASATNQPVNAFVEDLRRQYVQEFVREDFRESLPFCHPVYDGSIKSSWEELEPVKNVTSTTLLTVHSGKATLAAHGDMDFDENPAIVEAMRLNEIAVDQAEDAITASNIAILALPMAMSLIPVAFLADLNTCATLWYIIFTDIFSALPFLIKGIELVQSAEVRRSEVVAYHVGNETRGELEVWAAECSGDDSFRILGIVFVTIAVFAIAVGVLLELIAAMVMRRRRKAGGLEAEGPFGKAAFETTHYSLLGSARDDEKERRYSMEGERYALDESMAEKGLFLRLRKKVSDVVGTKTGKKNDKGEKSASKRYKKEDAQNLPGVGSDGLTAAERAEIDEGSGSGYTSLYSSVTPSSSSLRESDGDSFSAMSEKS